MKKIFILSTLLILGTSLFAENVSDDLFVVTSKYDFKTTVTKIKAVLKEKNLTVFADFDHRKNAEEVGLSMPSSQIIVFGNPKAGTQLMLQEPLAALELPMKIGVIGNKDKTVRIVFAKTEVIAKRYGIKDSAVLKNMQNLLETIVLSVNKS